MRNALLSLGILLCSVPAFAKGPFKAAEDLSFNCPGEKILQDGYVVECRGAKGFSAVKTAMVGANIKSANEVGIHTEVSGAVDLGILPDADSSPAYTYYRKLLSRSGGTIVGMLSTELWHNDEMGVKTKFKVYYTNEGKVAVINVEY